MNNDYELVDETIVQLDPHTPPGIAARKLRRHYTAEWCAELRYQLGEMGLQEDEPPAGAVWVGLAMTAAIGLLVVLALVVLWQAA